VPLAFGLGLVVLRPDLKVEAALATMARSGIAATAFAEGDCWMCNTQRMCAEVAAGRLAGGVVLDRFAAAAMALAGKVKGIRPVQGVSAAAVEAGLRQFDANVLVIGHEGPSVYEIRTMLDRFAAGRRVGRDRTRLLDAVDKLDGGR
jgi:ribose 5-phosphate isomerase RpiB